MFSSFRSTALRAERRGGDLVFAAVRGTVNPAGHADVHELGDAAVSRSSTRRGREPRRSCGCGGRAQALRRSHRSRAAGARLALRARARFREPLRRLLDPALKGAELGEGEASIDHWIAEVEARASFHAGSVRWCLRTSLLPVPRASRRRYRRLRCSDSSPQGRVRSQAERVRIALAPRLRAEAGPWSGRRRRRCRPQPNGRSCDGG